MTIREPARSTASDSAWARGTSVSISRILVGRMRAYYLIALADRELFTPVRESSGECRLLANVWNAGSSPALTSSSLVLSYRDCLVYALKAEAIFEDTDVSQA
jgi:hypothetical protein